MEVDSMLAMLTTLLLAFTPAPADEINAIIVQFTGGKVGNVEANTKDKAFRPVFEKDLKALVGDLLG